MRSHAATPVAIPLGEGLHRVYFTSRDEHDRSHVGFAELELSDEPRVTRVSENPVLAPGPLGHFDDHGVYAMSIVPFEEELRLYYVGFNPGPAGIFYPSIGLAISRDGGETFERHSAAPVMARSEVDPWMASAPFVIRDGGLWRMWYISGLGWSREPEGLVSRYHLKYAESDDGIDWRREGKVAIELAEGERNVARMCVLPPDEGAEGAGGYEGWYSVAGEAGYRVGYARSSDGVEWDRRDELAGIGVSDEGWDSEAVAYPFVFSDGGRRWMLYNGNDIGRAGFGLAEEVE